MDRDLQTVYGFSAPLLASDSAGRTQSLAEFRGRVLLIVNTASQCGFTPQYAGLEALYRTYRDRGFEVLGFPSNQFGAQEPGTEAEIGAFCGKNFGVSFPLFAKIDVNGPGAHPLYRFLKKERRGILGVFGSGRATWWRAMAPRNNRRLWQAPSNVCWESDNRGGWGRHSSEVFEARPERSVDFGAIR